MATTEQVASLRRMVDEATTDTYTDEALSAIIDAELSVDAAAATVWREKAAKASTLVNITESGSSRSMQQIFENAMKMANFYSTSSEEEVVVTTDVPFTSSITRE
jgi:hypothetical protein